MGMGCQAKRIIEQALLQYIRILDAEQESHALKGRAELATLVQQDIERAKRCLDLNAADGPIEYLA